MTEQTQGFWDAQAASFDEQPDHGLPDPEVRAAWTRVLLRLMPPSPATVIDLGCGTGTVAVLLAQAGYRVCGMDLSDRMLALARQKAAAAGVRVAFDQGDVSTPHYLQASCDVVLTRHVLWALPDPAAALRKWLGLLRPGGRVVLVEGRWFTGGGLSAAECRSLVLKHRQEADVHTLDDPALWGGPIQDERYALVSLR